MQVDAVLAEARQAKAVDAIRYSMDAAWRSPKDRDLESVCHMIEGVRELGKETSASRLAC